MRDYFPGTHEGKKAVDLFPYESFKYEQLENVPSASNMSQSFTYRHVSDDLSKLSPTYKVTFYKGFYYGTIKNKDSCQLLGVNHIWIGCPQPLCLFGTIDAAFRTDENGIYVTRGRYIWLIDGKAQPLVETADILSDKFKSLQRPFPDMIDAAFVLRNELFCFKEKTFYCFDLKSGKPCSNFYDSDAPTAFDGLPEYTLSFCDAAFSFGLNNTQVAVFGGSALSKLGIFNRVIPSKTGERWFKAKELINLPLIFEKKLDAAVQKDDVVYLFMGWTNYRVPLKAFISVYANQKFFILRIYKEIPFQANEIDTQKGNSKTSFEDPFKCPKSIYSSWVYDFDKYSVDVKELVETEKPESHVRLVLDKLSEAIRIAPGMAPTQSSALPFILAAILFIVIIIVAFVVSTEKKRRALKKKKRIKKASEVDLRAPDIGSCLETRSSLGSEILEKSYTPGKKAKSSLSIQSRSSNISTSSHISNLGSRTSQLDSDLKSKFDSKIFAVGVKKTKQKS
ncbi:hypothetical protein B4U79_17198 [Dinothrombium tinctorium]|uniref:Uncharacterized protein n=1 Tax=Dinothrombium tinctorium TaxID=1965070 RepID=A0A3S4QC32_9ACAR|nr:hypothetical protein B4U79_16767 [Dinothrombium tinctorium]RWS01485.1 hypothetical protein B4U79_16725 [Dinothrombium tinctorium]RWS01502.1 hypothetical protein B4U79_16723 [Dinothrombium tinctorium]RWS15946.1 hypothetical protein B4U79_17198 [Dinothrombium tinctorium]